MTRLTGLLGLALVLSATEASAFCRLTTSQSDPEELSCLDEGVPLEWRRACLSYSLDATGSRYLPFETVREVAGRSFGTWLGARCPDGDLPLAIEETAETTMCRRAEHDRDGPNTNVLAFADTWPSDYAPTAFAITTVYHSRRTGEILDADILINEEDYEWTVCPETGCEPDADGEFRQVDLENVLTHEVGHFLGLAHTDRFGSVMDAGSPIGDTDNRILRTDDRNGICAIYPPGADLGACDFAPRGGFDESCVGEGGCVAGPGPSPGWAWVALLFVVGWRRRTRA